MAAHVQGLDSGEEDLLAFAASFGRYNQIYEYHLHTAKNAMKGIVHEGDESAQENIRYVLGDAQNQERYNVAKIVNEANLLGAIHAVRASLDILSQLVNGLLLMSRFPIGECSIYKVTKALDEGPFKTQLQQLQNEPWYLYVSDFVNTIKHRRLMTHRFSVHFDRPGCAIYVDGFDYKGRSHPRFSDTDILKGTIELYASIIDCGKGLNAQVM
ncbi:MAG: hypothetical protein EA370_17125 [Wenzhouxiangella sp.]|nr:MAG: hypothetical protein EA370_17125 [Wenzhouxiangella sp.]